MDASETIYFSVKRDPRERTILVTEYWHKYPDEKPEPGRAVKLDGVFRISKAVYNPQRDRFEMQFENSTLKCDRWKYI